MLTTSKVFAHKEECKMNAQLSVYIFSKDVFFFLNKSLFLGHLQSDKKISRYNIVFILFFRKNKN